MPQLLILVNLFLSCFCHVINYFEERFGIAILPAEVDHEREAMTDHKEHWNAVYRTKGTEDLSWHQPFPSLSLQIIESLSLREETNIVDVGGGESLLAAKLAEPERHHVTVLDISEAALERGKGRAGAAAKRIEWLECDVRAFSPSRRYDLWHDRAVFHFLIAPEERAGYVAAVERSLVAGGHLIIATFAPYGPGKCSGLPVCRYGPEEMMAVFGRGFELVETFSETHLTPWESGQRFTYFHLRRISSGHG